MFNAQALTEKWNPVLSHEGTEPIKDNYKKAVTAVLLENQERFLREERGMINEAGGSAGNVSGAIGASGLSGSGLTTQTGGLAGFDPVLISLIRRAMPNLVAYDICGVQPMSGPTGLIFAMKSHFEGRSGAEALFNEPDNDFSAGFDASANAYDTANPVAGSNPGLLNDATGGGTTAGNYARGEKPMAREDAEALGESNKLFREMSFSIEKTSVTAQSRALKAEYTLELAQDLKAIHGLDAEQELANILSSEILAEINREVVRTVYRGAKPGAQANVANAGVFDLDVDSNGRWSVEKFKGLLFQIERDANAIAQETRRGKGNIIITSADVASALAMSGVLDYDSGISGAVGGIGEIDDTGNTFVGTLNGRFKVYIDPYSANVSDSQYYVVGYKGSNAYDAGLFYCPYVPLQMVRAIGEDNFQPRIGFKTRYGMVANPFATAAADGAIAGSNLYYRLVKVANLM